MRQRRRLVLGMIAGEAMVVLLLVSNAWLEFDRAEQRVVLQSRVDGEHAVNEAEAFFRARPNANVREAGPAFFSEMNKRRTPTVIETGEQWRPEFQQAPRAEVGALASASDAAKLRPAQVDVIRTLRKVAISIPMGAAGDPIFGTLVIEHDRRRIAEQSVLDPAWLFFQLVLFVLLSFQVCLTVVSLNRRDRVTVFEKGYLKEHAIGALKIQHRLLGQIIRDHEGEPEEVESPVPVRPANESGRGKVIQLDKLARKPVEDRGPRR